MDGLLTTLADEIGLRAFLARVALVTNIRTHYIFKAGKKSREELLPRTLRFIPPGSRSSCPNYRI